MSGPTNNMFVAAATHFGSATTNSATCNTPAWIAFECQSMAAWTAASTQDFTSTPGATTGLGATAAGVTISTTTVANDTVRSTYTFTAATTVAVYGHCCLNVSTAGAGALVLSWYAYAGVQNLTSGDTLAATIDHQFELGA
jgi:hypothetical protein